MLICFYGQFRSSPRTWLSIQEHLIFANAADAAIVTESSDTIPQYARGMFRYVWRMPVVTLYSWNEVENGDAVVKLLRSAAHVFPAYAFGGSRGSGTFIWASFLHAYRKMYRLDYSTFVMTRTDFHYLCPFLIAPTDNCMQCASIENYGGINDRHLVIPRRYLGILRVMHEMSRAATLEKGLWCFKCYTERVLLYVSKRLRIPICHYNMTMFLVRNAGDAVRSRKGTGRNVSCNQETYRVKYRKEFDFSTKQCNLDCSRGPLKRKNISVSF